MKELLKEIIARIKRPNSFAGWPCWPRADEEKHGNESCLTCFAERAIRELVIELERVEAENKRLREHLIAAGQETPGQGDECMRCESDERVATSLGLCPWCARDEIKQLREKLEHFECDECQTSIYLCIEHRRA